jgi:hypothetical protein
MSYSRRYAYFISPHGYGHAARASAVMAAILELKPESEFDIFTLVPKWFFEDSVGGHFSYFSLLTDIGLAQKTPLKADLSQTYHRLNRYLPFSPSKLEKLSNLLVKRKCSFVLCDIAPIGIPAARQAGIPSVLIENFTWDWIYQAYFREESSPAKFIPYLKGTFDTADFHIQTEPVCFPRPVNLRTSPVSRKPRKSPLEIRQSLQIPENRKMVLVTMGGLPMQYSFLSDLAVFEELSFILPGVSEKVCFQGNLRLLPQRSGYYHPDLVQACDVVIGKVGYSTLAEVYWAGVPFGYISRPAFRESETLVAFIESHLNGYPIREEEFSSNAWVSHIPELLSLSRRKPRDPEGAREIANYLTSLPDRPTYSGGAKNTEKPF